VKTVWHPLKDYSHEIGMSKKEWNELPHSAKQIMHECILVDHIDDDISNNNLDNLQYSTPLRNSNYRKKWK